MKAMAYIMYYIHSFNTATGEQRKLNATSTYWKDVPYISTTIILSAIPRSGVGLRQHFISTRDKTSLKFYVVIFLTTLLPFETKLLTMAAKPRPLFVYINGYPGVGKLSVARELRFVYLPY